MIFAIAIVTSSTAETNGRMEITILMALNANDCLNFIIKFNT